MCNKHVVFFGKYLFVVSGNILVKRFFFVNANILKGHNFYKYEYFFYKTWCAHFNNPSKMFLFFILL